MQATSRKPTPKQAEILLALILSLTCLSAVAKDETPEASSPAESGAAPAPTPEKATPPEEVKEPSVGQSVEPAAAVQNPDYHRAQMKLSGSMCFSCLHDLQKSLNKIDGILNVKIDPPVRGLQAYAPDAVSWAQAVIYYDAAKVQLQDLRQLLKKIGYHPYKIQDKPADKLPQPESKKKHDSA